MDRTLPWQARSVTEDFDSRFWALLLLDRH